MRLAGYQCQICLRWCDEIDHLEDHERPRSIGCEWHGVPFPQPQPRMDAIKLVPKDVVMRGTDAPR
jgi:hypothetical protein